jgi:hypothetical protein
MTCPLAPRTGSYDTRITAASPDDVASPDTIYGAAVRVPTFRAGETCPELAEGSARRK